MIRPAVLLFAAVLLLDAGLPVFGQASLAHAVAAAAQSALVLVECNDGTQRSYLTGVLAASNDIQSFVIVPRRSVPGQSAFVKCHGPIVHFGDDPARGYPAEELNLTQPGGMWIVFAWYYVLAVDHPVAHIAPLATAPPRREQPVTVVGFNLQSTSPPGALPEIVSVSAPFHVTSTANNEALFASTASIVSGIVVDPQTGAIFGIAGNVQNPMFPDLPRTYQLAGIDDITELLHEMPAPLLPGVSRTPAQNVAVEKLARAIAFPYFLRWPDNRADYLGWAVVLGTTATKTILATPGVRYPSHTGEGAPFVLVRDLDGTQRMVHASTVAVDTTGMAFVAVPRLDAPIPTFGAPASGTRTVAIPQIFGNLCTWTPPAPLPDDCPLRINVVSLRPPNVGYPTEIPLNLDVDHVSNGAPIIDLSSGTIVALDEGSGIPMFLVALKLEPLRVGISLTVHE